MAGAADDKYWRPRTTSFPYYVDTKKSASLTSNLSNSSTNKNSSFTDPRWVDPFSHPSNVRAPTRSAFGSDNHIKRIETELAGAGSISRHRTPSSRSDTALILQRNGSQAKQKKGRRRFLGHCFDKKSVHVINHPQPPSPSQRMEGERVLEESRRSIEVFGWRTSMRGEVARNMERKLSMLTWDAIPKPQAQSIIPAAGDGDGDDVASDTSSDLFEIENISGPAASSFCTSTSPASRYAPSEPSIHWSVATAADEIGAGNVKEAVKGRILGCRSQKAVDVIVAQNVASKKQGKGKLMQPAFI